MSNVSEEKLAALEALLFIHGEPLTLVKIGKMLGTRPEETSALIAALGARLAAGDRGLTLLAHGERIQLVTKPAFAKMVEQFIKSEFAEDLTPASLEALSLIAYFGPLSRSRLEYHRGVNSAVILRNLLLRGLIERFPDPAHLNSYLYRPSSELLRHLGVTREENLPEAEKFKALLARFEAAASEEAQTAGEGGAPVPAEP